MSDTTAPSIPEYDIDHLVTLAAGLLATGHYTTEHGDEVFARLAARHAVVVYEAILDGPAEAARYVKEKQEREQRETAERAALTCQPGGKFAAMRAALG